MLIDKEKREALVKRLSARWTDVATSARLAHHTDHKANGLPVERAIAGAQNNLLQVVVIDIGEILMGIDPTAERVQPLDNTMPAALAGAQRAIGAYLESFDVNVDDATRIMLLDELQATLKLLQEYVPMAVLEAMMAGQGSG
jgi:hypothetical protein